MTGTLEFDPATGKLTADTVLDLSITGSDSFTVDPIKVDFSEITSFGTESTIDCARGTYDGEGTGKKVGVMTSVGIDSNGNIVAKI